MTLAEHAVLLEARGHATAASRGAAPPGAPPPAPRALRVGRRQPHAPLSFNPFAAKPGHVLARFADAARPCLGSVDGGTGLAPRPAKGIPASRGGRRGEPKLAYKRRCSEPHKI